jgi:hypothetical protein
MKFKHNNRRLDNLETSAGQNRFKVQMDLNSFSAETFLTWYFSALGNGV